MTDLITVTYILNSGFLVAGGDFALVFDDFRDVTHAVDKAAKNYPRLYFFASHAHFDHFSPEIAKYADAASRYFLSEDIRSVSSPRNFPSDKTSWLSKYDSFDGDNIKVTSFDSTDAGTSFLVEIEGWRIFHAGDFNWWHWEGDTPENNSFARNGFMKQMKKLDGMMFDIAFFPVDGRLGDSMTWGAKEFCRRTDTRALVTMHSVGYPRWRPDEEFFEPGREIPTWSPRESGETMTLRKGGEFEGE